MTNPTILNLLLFAVLPYLALFIFFLGTIMRYQKAPFTYSSLSSQFLEGPQHFWGVVAFHYGVMQVLLGHFIALFIPRQILLWNSVPLRLYILEITALSFALMTLVGLLGTMERRAHFTRTRRITSIADWLIEAMLLIQVIAGIYAAIFHPWATAWYSASAVPYIRSIFKFNPDISYLATMPFVVKLADQGPVGALKGDPGFLAGLNVCGGKLTYEPVALAQGLDYVAPDVALGDLAAA